MKSYVIGWTACILAAATCERTWALPSAKYNPTTGGVVIDIDVQPVYALQLMSGSLGPGGTLTPMGQSLTGVALPIPGAVLEAVDQPSAITYLQVPLGTYFIGNVVTPGTPLSDLSLVSHIFATIDPPYVFGQIVMVPEPASAIIGLIALGAIRTLRFGRLPCSN